MYQVAMFLHSDLRSLNLKGSGKERTVQVLHPLQLELSVPTAINSSVFTTQSPHPLKKGLKELTLADLRYDNKSPTASGNL